MNFTFGWRFSEVESECFPEATITLLVLKDGDGTHEENSVAHQPQNFPQLKPRKRDDFGIRQLCLLSMEVGSIQCERRCRKRFYGVRLWTGWDRVGGRDHASWTMDMHMFFYVPIWQKILHTKNKVLNLHVKLLAINRKWVRLSLEQ